MATFEQAWAEFDRRTEPYGIKNLLLEQDGKIVGELHRSEDCQRNAYSATKSYTAVATGIARGMGLLDVDGLVPDDWVDYIQRPGCDDVYPQVDGDYRYGLGFWLHPNGCYMADGKFGQFSVVMQEKGAVLVPTSDCETPHETLRAFWETVYPTL